MKRTFAIVTSILLALPGRALSQAPELPTVFVPPFSGDITRIQYWQPALGQGLAEMLITELGKLGSFTMLESTQLEALKDEIKLGEDGWVEAADKVEKGGFAGADFMFTARVTQFGSKESNLNLGGVTRRLGIGNLGVRNSSSTVRIDWRFVDAANRKIIKTGAATGEEKGMGFDVGVFGQGGGGRIGFGNKEFMDSALGKATVTALNSIIAEVRGVSLPESARRKQKATVANQAAAAATAVADALRKTPGKVLAAPSKDKLVLSLGSKHGFKPGDSLGLYEVNEIKDDKGAVVFAEEKLVGEVNLQSVQEERSLAAYSGDKEVKPGWVVKAK